MASADQIYKQMQKMNNETSIKLQNLQNQANKQTLDFNKQEAATARAWQKSMSESSHQMEVKDLINAGLNPVLSANSGGAQSYTTSSASGTAESAGNAIAGLQSSLIGSMASLKGSEMSAAAQRHAAQQAAEATRAAAAQAAAAQKYAADKQYESTKYRADKDYKIAMNKPASTIAGVFDKWLQKNGIQKGLSGWIKKKPQTFTSKFANKDSYRLTAFGNLQAGSNLRKLGIANTQANRNTLAKAVFFNDSKAQAKIRTLKSTISTNKALYKYKVRATAPAMSARMSRVHQKNYSNMFRR